MLSKDCKKRVTCALVILAIALTVFLTFAIWGADMFMAIPKDIQLK